jgi:NitT/TauT family transport system substrate-binding protein
MNEAVLDTAWSNVVFTSDPLAATLRDGAAHAADVGLLQEPNLTGLYSLDLLNGLLKERGAAEVSDK